MPVTIDRELHSKCFFCGTESFNGMHIAYRRNPEKENSVYAEIFPGEDFQGYDSILHGGIISGILDEAMLHCIFLSGRKALTGSLNVRFLYPVHMGTAIKVEAELCNSYGKLQILKSTLAQNGKVCARAEGKFMEIP